jgi:hypothetical protein
MLSPNQYKETSLPSNYTSRNFVPTPGYQGQKSRSISKSLLMLLFQVSTMGKNEVLHGN